WFPSQLFADPFAPEPDIWVDSFVVLYYTISDDWLGCRTTDSILVKVEQMDTLKKSLDTSLCYPNAVQVNYSSSGVRVLWEDGYDSLSRFLLDSGLYLPEIWKNNCMIRDSLSINLVKVKTVIQGPDIICSGDSGIYQLSSPYDSLLWNLTDTGQFYSKRDSGWLYVTSYLHGCKGQDSLLVDQFNEHLFIGGARTLCEGDSVQLQVNPGLAKIEWSNGDT